MRTMSIDFAAGERIPFETGGSYFHLLETVAGLDIDFIRDGATIATATNMESGFVSKPEGGFSAFAITSAAAQTIKIAVGRGDGDYKRMFGSVTVSGVPHVIVDALPAVVISGTVSVAPVNKGASDNFQKTVTNANIELFGAYAGIKYLLIQNNDAAAVMRVRVDGGVASATIGLRLLPGESYEPPFLPTMAVNAFMETPGSGANNVDIILG